MKYAIGFSGSAKIRFLWGWFFLFMLVATGSGDPGCGCPSEYWCYCGAHCNYCNPGGCSCSDCPCSTCSDCTVCGECECSDCPGNCKEEFCGGCPYCETCTCNPECVDEDDSGFCDVCGKKFVCKACGKNPCNCPCPVCGKANGSCSCDICGLCGSKTCSGEACKDRYNNSGSNLSFEEWLAMEKYGKEKYNFTDEEFEEWLANYEGSYDDFVSTMKKIGGRDLPSLTEFILGIESTIDPINALTGELYFTEADIAIPATGIPLVFERHYSSDRGWRHSYDWDFKAIRDKRHAPRTVHVLGSYAVWRDLKGNVFSNSAAVVEDLKHILVRTGEGRDYRFEESDSEPGVFQAEAVDWKVVVEPVVEGGETNGCRYAIHQPGGITYGFESNRLESIEDEWANRVDFTYASNSLLAVHSCGTSLLLEHGGDLARPTRAWVSDDLYVDYAYDEARRLTNVVRHVDGETFEFTYQYDADGLMTNKTNPGLDAYRFAYSSSHTNDGLYTQGAVIHNYTDLEEDDQTTTLEIGDGWFKHRVEAHWGYDAVGWTNITTGESSSNEELYRYSDVVYDYGNGLEKKYRYEAANGLVQTVYGPHTNATGTATNRGVLYTYEGKNLATEKTFDDDLNESFTIHRQYDTNNHVTAIGVSCNTTNPVWQTHIAYDPVWQLPASVTNAEGHWTQTVYTNASPLAVKAFWSDTQSFDTTFGYYANGLLESVTNANQHATHMEHDAKGNLSLVEPPAGPQVSTTFNALGRMERSETLSENGASTGRVTEYGVAANGWVESITHPDGLEETFAYDKAGNITNATDRAGRATDYAYAPTKKLTSVTRYLHEGGSNVPVQVSYNYDKMFNALSITEPRGRYVESYQLDLQDRVVAVTNIEGQVMDIGYGVGDFARRIDRFDATAVTNAYDNAGRVSSATYLSAGQSPLATIGYSYYADGEIKTISDASSSISNSYDRLNRLTNSALSSLCSFAANHRYDAVGNITNTVVSANSAPLRGISFSYDEAERLEEISTDDAGVFEYAYDTGNGMVAIVSNTASGITCSYQYDIMDRATNIAYRTSDGTLIRSLDYEYDAASMIRQKTDFNVSATSTVSTSYIYDSLDRLVYESSSSVSSVVYNYDLAGNRLSKTENGLKTTYTLGTGNRLASATMQAVSNALFITGTASELIGTDERWGELWLTNLTSGASVAPNVNGNSFFAEIAALAGQTNTLHVAIRDRAGNMGYAVKDFWVGTAGATNAMQEYAYDVAGCLTNLNGLALDWDERYRLKNVDGASCSVAYEYDVLNRRTSRIEGSTTNYFIYNGNQVAADLDENGDLLRTYVWGQGIDNLLAMTVYGAQTNTYYAIKNLQNSAIALVDDTGAVVESYVYSAYGETTVFNSSGTEISESALGNRYCFQGREIDWDTGLYYFRARWYDPETGRWLSKDLIGIAGGLNQYVFCANNPVNFVDPMGLVNLSFDHPGSMDEFVDSHVNPDNYFSVGGHGYSDGSGISDQRTSERGTPLSASDLASIIKNHPDYDGSKPVKLYACNTGGAYAKELAKFLNNTVIAPKGNVSQHLFYIKGLDRYFVINIANFDKHKPCSE